MNIFYLDKNPRLAAEYHCDKHVVKMILESAQLLSAAHRFLDGKLVEGEKYVQGSLPARWRKTKKWKLLDDREQILYSASHINHPSCVWTRSNIDHYRYLYELFVFLIDEYKYRYKNKQHKCEQLVEPLFDAPLWIDSEAHWEDPPQCMPDECKVNNDTVSAYRNYYIMHKSHFAKWTRRPEPTWYKSLKV